MEREHMQSSGYRYQFASKADLADAQDLLRLAALAAGGIFGRARVRMDARFWVDESIDVLVLDASTVVGLIIAAIFTSFIDHSRVLGGFDVRRVEIQE